MEDRVEQVDQGKSPTRRGGGERSSEPVRSRWTPKPEQILILESIFNSGMVNPPKDETVRIRKLLEKYGAVGDANVFYWFQNRRSRSRRRQRQIQAALLTTAAATATATTTDQSQTISPIIHHSPTPAGGFDHHYHEPAAACFGSFSPAGSSSTSTNSGDLFSISQQMGLPDIDQSSMLCPPDISSLHYQSGSMTVFINGVATEVPRGAFDMTAMFGENIMLVHSSGIPVSMNEYGVQLQMGENYFLLRNP